MGGRADFKATEAALALPVVTSIKVPARWRQDGRFVHGVAEFKLGKGPCGLTVSSLSYTIRDGVLTIDQRHTEGGPKAFVYPLDHLTGRIEVTKG